VYESDLWYAVPCEVLTSLVHRVTDSGQKLQTRLNLKFRSFILLHFVDLEKAFDRVPRSDTMGNA